LTVLALKTISYYISECSFVLVVVTSGVGEPAVSIVTITLKMKQACPSWNTGNHLLDCCDKP